MSHSPSSHGHDDHAPAKPKKIPKHGPNDCYGMPQKKFWRIVFVVGGFTATLVVAAVILLNRPPVL